MSLRDRQAAVAVAARECAQRRAQAHDAWRRFKDDTERAATPARIVGAGLVAGFASGLAAPSAAYAAPLGEKLFRALLDSAFANVGAAFAAGLAAAGAADALGADARTDAAGAQSAPVAD